MAERIVSLVRAKKSEEELFKKRNKGVDQLQKLAGQALGFNTQPQSFEPDKLNLPSAFLELNPVNHSGETPFCLALMHNQKKALSFAIHVNNENNRKFDVNYRRRRGGFTPLHIAVVINNLEALSILLR